MPFLPDKRQYRSITGLAEFAADDGDELVLSGIPIVFNSPTVLWTAADGTEYREQIDPHAYDGCDFSDFIFNRNHGENDGTVYARSKNGTIEHTVTERGVEVRIHLDKNDPRHVYLYNDIRKGLIDRMSHSFPGDYEYSYDSETHTRTITRVRKLYDVSAVDFPAYEGATISARSFFSEEHEKEVKGAECAVRRKRLLLRTYF